MIIMFFDRFLGSNPYDCFEIPVFLLLIKLKSFKLFIRYGYLYEGITVYANFIPRNKLIRVLITFSIIN